jgi:hypothetical protein
MGLTSNQLPYPEPTDSVDVVRDVKALADALNPRVPPDATATFAVNALFTASENTLWRRFGWWHLHLILLNATAGSFPAGPLLLGTIPAVARGNTSAASLNVAGTYVTPSGAVAPVVWPTVATWADGTVRAANPVALPSHSIGELLLRLDMHWPMA